MNAARFARHLIEDGVDQKLADSLAEHLADEIERTVATKDHVEMVVTRESQQLRIEMHELRGEMHRFRAEMHQEFQRFDERITQRLDMFQNQMTQRLDSQSRWLTTSMIVLFLAILGNIIKDFVR